MSFMSLQVSLILFTVLFLSLYSSFAFIYNGHEIRDLQLNGALFTAEANAWTASSLASTSDVYVCNNVSLVGGYGILGNGANSGTFGQYFQRIYTQLPPHNIIYYTITFWLLDSWDYGSDYFNISFDSTMVNGWQADKNDFPSNLCGWSNWDDVSGVQTFGQISHSQSTLTLKIISGLDQGSTDESLGFRNVQLLFANSTTSSGVNSICAVSPVPLNQNLCSCPIGKYYHPQSGKCKICDVSCSACFGPLSNECYSCSNGYFFNGTDCVQCASGCSVCNSSNQCNTCQSGYFLYPNNTCLPQCNSPMVQNSTTSTLLCQRPCNVGFFLYQNGSCLPSCNYPYSIDTTGLLCLRPCSTGQYLYWDGSCDSTCPFPLETGILDGISYCNYSCDVQEYLYPDTSCSSTCNSPLVSYTLNDRNLCEYPCPTSTFLYEDGSCLPTCNSPYIQTTEYGKPMCNFPCNSTEFLYWDGTCNSTCPYPLNPRTEGVSNFYQYCDYGCDTQEYLYPDASCSSTCPFPLEPDTLKDRNLCGYPCPDSTFLYTNGSCLSTCDSPFTKTIEYGKSMCNFPCVPTGFLYWDGTCNSDCPFPLNPRTEEASKLYNHCDYECDTNDFLYWNGSCSSDCGYPLVANSYKQRNFCQYPCEGPQDFIYYNNTCQNTCPSPLVSRREGFTKFCDLPCSTGQYLISNGSCTDTCKSPLSTRIENGISYCDYPCLASEFLFWNGTCITSCNFPLRSLTGSLGELCYLPCNSPYQYYYSETGECKDTCTLPKIIVNEGLFFSCQSYYTSITSTQDAGSFSGYGTSSAQSSQNSAQSLTSSLMGAGVALQTATSLQPEPNIITLILVIKVLKYIRYLDINFPTKLQNLLESSDSFILNFGPEASEGVKNQLPNHPLPYVFERYDMNSSFLINCAEVFTTLLILFGVVIFLACVQKVAEKFNKKILKQILGKISVIVRWNLILIILIGNLDEVILYSSLEFMTLKFDSALAAVSFFSCLFMILLAIPLVAAPFYLLRKMHTIKTFALAKQNYDEYAKFHTKWQGFHVLWGGIRESTKLKQACMSVILMRTIIVYLIASYLYSSPVAQSTLYIVVSALLISYLIYSKPFIKRVELIQTCVYEVIMLVINIGVFILAVLDSAEQESVELRTFLGNIIIFCHISFNVIAGIFLGAKLLIKTRYLYLAYKKQIKQTNKGWLKALMLAFQQTVLGSEEDKSSEISSSNLNLITKEGTAYLQRRLRDIQGRSSSITTTKINIFDEDGGISKVGLFQMPMSPYSEENITKEDQSSVQNTFLLSRNSLFVKFDTNGEPIPAKTKQNFELFTSFEEEHDDKEELHKIPTLSRSGSSRFRPAGQKGPPRRLESKELSVRGSIRESEPDMTPKNSKTHWVFTNQNPKTLKKFASLEPIIIPNNGLTLQRALSRQTPTPTDNDPLQVIHDQPDDESHISEFSFIRKNKGVKEMNLNIEEDMVESPSLKRAKEKVKNKEKKKTFTIKLRTVTRQKNAGYEQMKPENLEVGPTCYETISATIQTKSTEEKVVRSLKRAKSL